LGNEANILKYRLAVAGLRNSGDSLRLAHAVRHLGDAYYYAGQRELAEPCYVEALSIYRSRTDRRSLDLANAIRSYAVIKAELGATNEAKSLWQEAHDLYVSVEVHAGVAESAARLALLAQRENDLRQSRAWLAEATRAAAVANDPETSRFVAEVEARIDASNEAEKPLAQKPFA
jgi:tetratricopeptide (TPR) repeat protein